MVIPPSLENPYVTSISMNGVLPSPLSGESATFTVAHLVTSS